MLLIKTWNRCWSAPHFIFFPNISWRFFIFGTVDLECIADVRLQVKNNGISWSNFKIAAVQELYWDFSCSLAISKSNLFFSQKPCDCTSYANKVSKTQDPTCINLQLLSSYWLCFDSFVPTLKTYLNRCLFLHQHQSYLIHLVPSVHSVH